jgi:hypothetical protein
VNRRNDRGEERRVEESRVEELNSRDEKKEIEKDYTTGEEEERSKVR